MEIYISGFAWHFATCIAYLKHSEVINFDAFNLVIDIGISGVNKKTGNKTHKQLATGKVTKPPKRKLQEKLGARLTSSLRLGRQPSLPRGSCRRKLGARLTSSLRLGRCGTNLHRHNRFGGVDRDLGKGSEVQSPRSPMAEKTGSKTIGKVMKPTKRKLQKETTNKIRKEAYWEGGRS